MFSRIDPKELNQNVFSMIGEQWMLVTAGTVERCNTMTASWGGLGVLWGKPVATVYIRPQRYTLEFVERENCFTLSFFGEEYRKALALCGSKSGRDVDKVKECGFTVAGAACGAPYFEEAGLVLGMTKRQIFFKVTLLQMVKRIVPPMSNEIITLVKDTSLARAIALQEVIWAAESFMKGNQGISGLWWPLMFTAVYYLAFSAIVTMLLGRLEKKLDYFQV